MYRTFFLFGLIIFFNFSGIAQDRAYALDCVKQLASPRLHGRGFARSGDRKAAAFIVQELKKFKTKAFNASFEQKFPIAINSIQKTYVKIDDKVLKLGKDYLVNAASGSSKGRFNLLYPENFEKENFKQRAASKCFFVLDTLHYKSKDLIANYHEIIRTCAYGKAAGILEISPRRLIQVQSTFQLDFPYLQLDSTLWNPNNKEIKTRIKARFKPNYITQNIAAYIEGETDSFYVFTAHYDHLGKVGKHTYFPGANDNGSGVAVLLDLIKTLKQSNKKPKYNIAFLFFSGEEAGLLGSKYYTGHPLFPLEKIKFLINLDMVGTGTEGLSIVNGILQDKASQCIKKINKEGQFFDDIRVGKLSANSDHYFFHEAGVPAIFLFTRGGPQFYHDINDRWQTLKLNKHNELINTLIQFIKQYE